MIEPLKDSLVRLLLEGIHQDRIGDAQSVSSDIIKGVIHSFVGVQEYKKKDNLEVKKILINIFMSYTSKFFPLILYLNLSCCLNKISLILIKIYTKL